LLVCGGRHYRNAEAVRMVLDAALRSGPVTIIQGGARGADKLAREWADDRAVECITFAAEWDRDGTMAGPIRNQRMLVEGKPDMVLAFPGGNGTANMIRKAQAARVLVVRFPPTGDNRMPFGLD
jgi:hypothetical protein